MRRLPVLLSAIVLLLFAWPASAAAPGPAISPDDEKLLRTARVGTDGPALLDYFRKRTLTPAQRGRIRALIPQLGDDSFPRRQRASLELMTFGPAALAHLRQGLDDPDEEIKERLRACIGGLEKNSSPAVGAAAARLLRIRAPLTPNLSPPRGEGGKRGAVDVLLAHLPDADTDAVAEEVLATLAVLGVRDGKVAPALIAALKDREPARRAGAALVVGRSGSREQRAVVQAMQTDPAPAVRFRAAQGLLAARDRAAIPVLIALLTEGPPHLAVRAEELLSCTAGSAAPHAAPGEDAIFRRRCRALWTSWWRSHNRVDLTRADVDLPAFNGTLRARQAARQFLLAFFQGDSDRLKKSIEAPFLCDGEQVLNKVADMEKVIDRSMTMIHGDNAIEPYSVLAVRSLDNSVRLVSATERAFLGRFRRGELRVIEVRFQAVVLPTQRAIVLVRLSGGQAHVVGFDPSTGLTPLLTR